MKPRLILNTTKTKVEEELNRLLKMETISLISTSDYGTSLVPVLKAEGSIRLCGDYKVTQNKNLKNVKYLPPRIEEILRQLNRGESFSKIDCSDTYPFGSR